MRRKPDVVRRELRGRVLLGYEPSRTKESAVDHWSDWFVLSPEEFEQISDAAVRERSAMLKRERETAHCSHSRDT